MIKLMKDFDKSYISINFQYLLIHNSYKKVRNKWPRKVICIDEVDWFSYFHIKLHFFLFFRLNLNFILTSTSDRNRVLNTEFGCRIVSTVLWIVKF